MFILHVDDEQEWLDAAKTAVEVAFPEATYEGFDHPGTLIRKYDDNWAACAFVIMDGYIGDFVKGNEVAYRLRLDGFTAPILLWSAETKQSTLVKSFHRLVEKPCAFSKKPWDLDDPEEVKKSLIQPMRKLLKP